MNRINELLLKVKNDDNYALEELVNKYEPLMKKYIKRANLPTIEQKEETYYRLVIRIWEATKLFDLNKIDDIENIEAVFFRFIESSIRNQVANMKYNFGKVMEKQFITSSLDYDHEILIPNINYTFDQDLIDRKYVHSLVNRLDDDSKIIIYLYYFENYTDADISPLFDLTRSCITVRRKKALQKLSNFIMEDMKRQSRIDNKIKKEEWKRNRKKSILMKL